MKIGDKVVRINCANGPAAKVGQEARIVGIGSGRFRGMIYVTYPGCKPEYGNSGEGWYKTNAKVVPPTPSALDDLIAAKAAHEITTKAFVAAKKEWEAATTHLTEAQDAFNKWMQQQIHAKVSEVKS